MNVFDVLTLIGGLCLFLFGMNIMGDALERRAGNKLKTLIGKLTGNKLAGLLTGLGVTAVIQSSSATTVMVVGFANSGLITLKQSIGVIMGANIGTTVTAWLLSLGGIESSNIFLQLLKPTSFTPVLALFGIIFYMFCKSGKKNDTGMIFLGFATLMFGMETMSDAVAGLADVPAFGQLFLMFTNPILGVLAGAVLTAIIQSSSASVGILQALAVTGQVSYGAAIPIIMGQNIGTCITAMLSSVGTNKNAKRAAMVHLCFNILGTLFWLSVFWLAKLFLQPILFTEEATRFGIAVAHSVFNILCTLLMFPLSGVLEKIVLKLVPDAKTLEVDTELDERLLATPPIALERCRVLTEKMAVSAADALRDTLRAFESYSPELAESIRASEEQTDHYEDILGTYLVKLSGRGISSADSVESAKLLKLISDIERISDHSVNILESVEELREKEISFTPAAKKELNVLIDAVHEILDLSMLSFLNNDLQAAEKVEPLEQIIDNLKEHMRTSHILRLQQGNCTIEAGFVWSDLLTNLERISDHCSNMAGCVIDMTHNNMNLHASLRAYKMNDPAYGENYEKFKSKYAL